MLKGTSTLVEYDQCMKKGLCDEHLKEIKQIFYQNEVGAAVKHDFPKKAFRYVRVNILYPFLTNKPPKCEKIKKLMEKTESLAKIFADGKAGHMITDEAANIILVVDSVVIFTLCQLSKICCIGAIFHTKTSSNNGNPEIKALQNLLLIERLNADICYLFPVLQKNFIGFEYDIVRATHCITLLFIRKFCNKGSMKLALETILRDIKTNCEFDQVTVTCNEINIKNMCCVIRKTSTASSVPFNFYKSADYASASEYYYNDGKYGLASFFGYLAVSMENTVSDVYFPYLKALIAQKLYKEAMDVIHYGFEHTDKNSKYYKKLTKLFESLSKHSMNCLADHNPNTTPVFDMKEDWPDTEDEPVAHKATETENNQSKKSVNNKNTIDRILASKIEKSKSNLVDLVDSDSGGSDSEVQAVNVGEITVVDSADISDDNSEIGEDTELKSDLTGNSRKIYPGEMKLTLKKNSKNDWNVIKQDSSSQDTPNAVVEANHDNEMEIKAKKQMINGTKEKEKAKVKSHNRRKRTVSEGSNDNQLDEEIDINKMNSYLKEASEALLADCGYKAVQIFRGPLRKFMESSNFLSFERCDIVCIKYSYGIAYCKSGGHDDLEKCISILKDIIENYDSITFPAAYYSLGVAFRKLNRFKEALNYLEIVQNILNKGIHSKVYSWPGMTTVIQETKPDVLKNLVQDLIKECENPPNPDAFCRFENCSFQPSIYYSDPDFKGYISLFCSEQCNLQYHVQCWKTIKEEKKSTDKEFLDKSCFTPDCEGVISKIQNIDKKGDLSKEFVSEFKKPQKVSKKWDKKSDTKEKKKKKGAARSEGSSQEVLTENGKDRSRKSSICDNEAFDNKKERSRESSICDYETLSQFSGSYNSNEEVSSKSEYNKKASDSINEAGDLHKSSSNNHISNSLPENSYTNHVEEFKELHAPLQENKSDLLDCITANVYSYMAEFLQHHGPLRINDPLLTNEIESFPDETYNIVSKVGGIGEFLKNDLRFAFVGDLYVCVIDDLAKAYQMLSLPTGFKDLQTLESNDNLKYYSEKVKFGLNKNSSFLNPDAQEYTPSSNKSNAYNLITNDSHQDFESHCSIPLNHESSNKYKSSVSELDTFLTDEIIVAKPKNCEIVSDSSFQNTTWPKLPSGTSENNQLISNESNSKSTSHSSLLNQSSNYVTDSEVKSANIDVDDFANEVMNSKRKDIEAEITTAVNQLFRKEMKDYRQFIINHLKPHITNNIDELIAAGIVTNDRLQSEESKEGENSSTVNQDDFESLKKEIYDLTKQNSSLQNVLECSTEQQQKLSAEVNRLKKCVNESTLKVENMKKEFEKKEKELLKEKVSLVQSLTDANKFVGTLQQKNALLAEEKLKLQKAVDNLTLSLKKEEENMKNVLALQEKKFTCTIESLQKENLELKSRTKYAELQVLYMKKSEYLKKIEAKFFEVEEVKKEMNTPSMQLWANAAGPEQIKILSIKINSYVEELKAIKLDFIEKIDEQIKQVKAGASLKDIKEVEMKDLAPVPTYKNTLPENLLAGMSRFSSMTLPYFGNSSHMPSTAIVPPVPAAASLLSSSTSALKISIPTATAAKVISPVSPSITTKHISPIAPAATAKNIPPVQIAATSIINPVTPSAAVIPPNTPPITPASLSSSLSTEPSLLSVNKNSKLDLVNDINDPTIQESFKNAMASINSFASSPYTVQPLDEEFDKHYVVFKHPEPLSNNIKPDFPKVPPGLVNTVPHSASARKCAISSIPETVAESHNPIGEKSSAALDPVSRIKVESNQSTLEAEKKKSTASYAKLLCKLKEQFPTFSQDELMSYVKEVRDQRQGKLSGLTIDAIISEISAIMKAKKKIPEPKVQLKPAKVLVNKKLVPDPPKPTVEPQTTKKKTAWNIDTDAAKRRFSGSAEDDCTICCDSMLNAAYKVACGHFFHEDCIRQWLKKNSNCPICRVLLLLPEEYPSLS